MNMYMLLNSSEPMKHRKCQEIFWTKAQVELFATLHLSAVIFLQRVWFSWPSLLMSTRVHTVLQNHIISAYSYYTFALHPHGVVAAEKKSKKKKKHNIHHFFCVSKLKWILDISLHMQFVFCHENNLCIFSSRANSTVRCLSLLQISEIYDSHFSLAF